MDLSSSSTTKSAFLSFMLGKVLSRIFTPFLPVRMCMNFSGILWRMSLSRSSFVSRFERIIPVMRNIGFSDLLLVLSERFSV